MGGEGGGGEDEEESEEEDREGAVEPEREGLLLGLVVEFVSVSVWVALFFCDDSHAHYSLLTALSFVVATRLKGVSGGYRDNIIA